MLLLRQTLNTIFDEIIRDEHIMKLMNLPTINDNDPIEINTKKTNQVIKRAITFSSENPGALGERFPKIKIGDNVYSDYGKIRMTICNMQSDDLGSDIFGRPRVEIAIYHLSEDTEKALEIINYLAKKFSRRKIEIEWTDDAGFKHISYRELTCRGIITQVPNINNYEKSGIRFSYFASYYTSY